MDTQPNSGFENRRGPGTIRDHVDCGRALDEVESLMAIGESLNDEHLDHATKLQEQINLFLTYAPENSIKPRPHALLAYLLTYVKQMRTEQAAHETGIADLEDILLRRREPNHDEAALLSRYFEVADDAFQ